MKKIIASILLCAFAMAFACSCGGQNAGGESSNTAKPESSTITTSSLAAVEENSSKEDGSSVVSNTSKVPVGRPGSSSNSQSIKVAPANRKCVVFCGFSTDTCDSYGTTREDKLREIEDVVAAGYVNSLSCRGNLKQDDYWDIVIKYDLTVWYSEYATYDSTRKNKDGTPVTIDQHFKSLYDVVDNYIKPYPERWERFNGFWYDEHIWRGETNEDFVTVTKTLYQKYGKRNYAVVATGEISGIEGNADLIGTTADKMNKMLPESFEVVTDAGFDSYGIDVRDGAPNGNIAEAYKDELPGIHDGPTYYYEYTQLLLRLVGHKVNLWYLPCAYTCRISGGLDGITKANEEYCLAHLNYFYDQLEHQEYAGGLMLYVYGLSEKSEKAGTKGLKYHLVVEGDADSSEVYKLRPETTKWKKYSKRLREIVQKYNSKEVPLIREP